MSNSIHDLPRGQDDVPNIPHDLDLPCRNEEVSGRKASNGHVVDLWAGEYGDGKVRKEAYREAASLCWSVCAVDTPEAFSACAKYQAAFKPRYMVFGGVVPGECDD